MKFSVPLLTGNLSFKTTKRILKNTTTINSDFVNTKLITFARTVSIFMLASAVLLPNQAVQASTALTTFDTGYCAGEEYGYTGSDQLVTVPPGATKMKVKAWGAGGGKDGGGIGGAGGYVEGEVPVVPGASYQAVVGAIGQFTNQYGFGGKPHSASLYGGGLAGLFTGTAPVTATDQARAVLVAGGGGSGEKTAGQGILVHFGGHGGDPTLSGGQVGTMLGQDGINTTGSAVPSSGGSGGGYEGGSGHQRGGPADSTGPTDNYGGGGGSNYINSALVTAGTTQNLFTPEWTNPPKPPNIADIHYNSPTPPYITGQGIAGSGSNAGGHGLVVVQFDGCIPPVDTDADGIDDSVDLDDDNDGIIDVVEIPPAVGAITAGNITPNPIGTYSHNRGLSMPFTLTGSDSSLSFYETMPGVTEGLMFRWVQPNTLANFGVDLTLTAPVNATLKSIRVGDAAPGHTQVFANANKDIVMTWPGGGSAVLIDPNGDISSHSDGATLVSGDTITAVGGSIATSTWKLDIDLTGVTFPVVIGYDSINYAAAKGNEGFAFIPVFEQDRDGDGIPEHLDLDSDNDGVSDLYESGDAAGLADDANNDGTINIAESVDTDADGLIDVFEDGNLSADTGTVETDLDGDGLPNAIDLDSDADGIPDTIEARPTAGYAVNDNNVTDDDADGDGVIALFDSNDASTGDYGGDHANFNAPVDTDGDGTADWLDSDSDDDQIPDTAEVGFLILADFFDPDGQVTTPTADLYDENSALPDVGFREITDTDGDGTPDGVDIDNDNDGIPDVAEFQCAANTTASWDTAVVDGDLTTNFVLDNGTTGSVVTIPNFLKAGFPKYSTIGAPVSTLRYQRHGDGTPPSFGNETVVTFNTPIVNQTFHVENLGKWGTPGIFDETMAISFFLNGTEVSFYPSIIANGGTYLAGTLAAIGNGAIPQAEYTFNITSPVDEIRIKHIGRTDGTSGEGLVNFELSTAGCLSEDFDADGIPDFLDLDSDNDGITDTVEAGGVDADGDGIVDGFTDADGDGMDDATNTAPLPVNDFDGDGQPDHLDLDSDNDGLTDASEAGGSDTDGDGVIDGFTDADNDGLDDNTEATPLPVNDTDGDGSADHLDLDADGDGLDDIIEGGGTDSDGDGLVDSFTDADENGLDDATETTPLPDDDFDGDGIPDHQPDHLDLDADNDGIPDADEGPGDNADADGDGIDDYYDVDVTNGVDVNNDGVDDAIVAEDFDGDGIPDYLDLDSDNDGLTDAIEAGGTDADGDGIVDGFVDADDDGLDDATAAAPLAQPDTDGDNTPNHLDVDSDNDGITDANEAGGTDADGDGEIDGFTDANNDGLDDATATTPLPVTDTDGDNQPDHLELDSDNDGLTDVIESGGGDTDGDGMVDGFTDADNDGLHDGSAGTEGPDFDSDGTPNEQDVDSDGDGIPDAIEAANGPVDSDGDGQYDHLDLDSDNDGLPDSIEGGATGIDSDGDGIDDAFDVDAITGGVDANGDGVEDSATAVDNDGDSLPDYLDLDSDNDGLTDANEAGGTDADGDGIVDGFTDVNSDGLDDNTATTPLPVDDSDGDGIDDYLDLDSDNDGLPDVIESGGGDTDGDGMVDGFTDANNDGLHDGSAGTFGVDTDSDGLTDHLDQDSDNDGITDASEAGGTDADGDGEIDGFTDANGDGLDDATATTALPAPDTDGDGDPDHLDLDSDNDGLDDIYEAGGTDADGDGMVDN